MSDEPKQYFFSSAERDLEELTTRLDEAADIVPFGIPFLDKILGGILPSDLILIGAATGRGKTELAVDIALNACKKDRRVHMFALEAEHNEVERRMKYKTIAESYYKDGGREYINYQDWRMGKLHFLAPYELQASAAMGSLKNLYTFYRDEKFNIHKFEEIFNTLKGQSDLVIIDHIHYFDFDSENENKAIGDIVKKIKDLSQINRIPVILIAHLRKTEKKGTKNQSLCPSIDDFHGTSNLAKICTRSIVLGNGGLEEGTKFPITYIRAVKNRLGGERLWVVGKTLFDTKRNRYIEKVKFGRLTSDESEFIEFNDLDRPHWLEG